jgi:Asp/Glu/hydantoin racemase
MSSRRLLVINPNSNTSVTAGIDDAVAEFRRRDELSIDCVTLPDAPFGIESDDDIAAVVPMIIQAITEARSDYDAFVIACYSGPGLDESRAACSRPVFGIHESALTLAAAAERPFGVLALSSASIERHIAYIQGLQMQRYHVGERALNLSVDDAANGPEALQRIIAVGRGLIKDMGAESLVLGCAGMARHREAAEAALGVPVIDPVQAAVGRAFATGG